VPVSLHLETQMDDRIGRSIDRIVKDLDESHSIHQVVMSWRECSEGYDLWLGEFNDRIIAFVLVQGSKIKALAVHGATRNRGVGLRILTLLREQQPDVEVDLDHLSPWIGRYFK